MTGTAYGIHKAQCPMCAITCIVSSMAQGGGRSATAGRMTSRTMNAATATSTIEAPAATSRCHESKQPERAAERGDRRREGHHRRQPLGHSAAAAGGAISSPSTSSAPTTRNPTTTASASTTSITSWRRVDRQAERRRALAIEREHQERPVEHRDEGQNARREHGGAATSPPADPEHIAEQERGEVDRVALDAARRSPRRGRA